MDGKFAVNGQKLALMALAIVTFHLGLHAKKKSSGSSQPVTVARQIEPFYPNWAYNNGIGEGFAKIAFYVDENGVASEYFVIEYSHKAFGEAFMKVLPKWKFEAAHEFGKPVKSVCHAYWEFLPDRAIVTNALFDTSKRIKKGDAHSIRELQYYNEKKLDAKLRMLAFPEIVAPNNFDSSKLTDGRISVSCNFYVDQEGAVRLPTITRLEAPELKPAIINALKQAAFERPMVDGEHTIAWLEKTYLVSVTTE